MKISVVIPVYNEINTFLELYRQVQAVPLDKEIIIVDDGSTDGTRDILHEIHDENTKIFYQEKNKGKGSALQEGFKHISGDIAIIQDADLEYYPSEYPLLISKIIERKADVVYGTRFMGARRVFAFHHAVGNAVLNFLANVLYDTNLSDYMTCFKAFRADIAKNLDLRANGFAVESEITAKIFKQRLKVYEVPISYNGRTYDEGKKIKWSDFFPCLWWLLKCKLAKYDIGEDTLARLRLLPNNNRWIFEKIRPHLGQHILEIGSGIGNISNLLVKAKRDLVLSEINPRYLDYLKERFIGNPNVQVVRFDAASQDLSAFNRPFDTIVNINVLEHIENDAAALKNMYDLLEPDGRIILVVPAHQALYGSLDKHLDHFRRYTRKELEQKIKENHFQVEDIHFHNCPATIGWYLNGRIFKSKLMSAFQVRLFDRFVPLLAKIEARIKIPWGLSLVVVAKKK